jgi:uncharacterized membrane protein YoaK (UPF0700 family)
MFVAQAHSFAQQARLAITLAWVAGYTNIVSILLCGHVTSHVSGTTSDLGRAVVERNWALGGFLMFLLVTFFLGAALSGVAVETGRRRGWESIYVLPIAIEAALLACMGVGVALARGVEPGALAQVDTSWLFVLTGAAAMAMGLQNATITRISSGAVRTTHVTGVLTDLGTETALFLWWLRDRHVGATRTSADDATDNGPTGHGPTADRHAAARARALMHSVQAHPTARRLALLGGVVASFALGAALGTLAFEWAPTTRWAMLPPVAFLVFIIYQDLAAPIAEIEASGAITRQSLALPEALGVHHLRKDQRRTGSRHRMPDLLTWGEHLPPVVRVVVLDLCEETRFDSNAALELRALARHLQARRCALVIAGVDAARFRQLRAAGAGDQLTPENVCPDLELAIARGLAVLDALGAETPNADTRDDPGRATPGGRYHR